MASSIFRRNSCENIEKYPKKLILLKYLTIIYYKKI